MENDCVMQAVERNGNINRWPLPTRVTIQTGNKKTYEEEYHCFHFIILFLFLSSQDEQKMEQVKPPCVARIEGTIEGQRDKG